MTPTQTKAYTPDKIAKYTFDLNCFFFKRYFSLKKVGNYLRSEYARLARLESTLALPSVIYIDPGNICSLSCPLCTTGAGQAGRQKGLMGFETCKKIINQLSEYLFFARLYNWGEPLLNKDIFRMIEYIHGSGVGTVINSNLNFNDHALLEKIVISPLDCLIVSIDGVTQQVYGAYRRGGDLGMVLGNLRKIIALKERHHKQSLRIEWLFVINRKNLHQIDDAIELARKIRVDTIFFTTCLDALALSRMDKRPSPVYEEFCLEDNIDYFPGLLGRGCSSLYNRMIFNWDETISPCCALDEAREDFGSLSEGPIIKIWNNQKYRNARRLFRKKSKGLSSIETICQRCLFFNRGTAD